MCRCQQVVGISVRPLIRKEDRARGNSFKKHPSDVVNETMKVGGATYTKKSGQEEIPT